MRRFIAGHSHSVSRFRIAPGSLFRDVDGEHEKETFQALLNTHLHRVGIRAALLPVPASGGL